MSHLTEHITGVIKYLDQVRKENYSYESRMPNDYESIKKYIRKYIIEKEKIKINEDLYKNIERGIHSASRHNISQSVNSIGFTQSKKMNVFNSVITKPAMVGGIFGGWFSGLILTHKLESKMDILSAIRKGHFGGEVSFHHEFRCSCTTTHWPINKYSCLRIIDSIDLLINKRITYAKANYFVGALTTIGSSFIPTAVDLPSEFANYIKDSIREYIIDFPIDKLKEKVSSHKIAKAVEPGKIAKQLIVRAKNLPVPCSCATLIITILAGELEKNSFFEKTTSILYSSNGEAKLKKILEN